MKAGNTPSPVLNPEVLEQSVHSTRFPLIRWILFAPTGIAAYLLVIIIFVFLRSLAGTADERDLLMELSANFLAACISSAAAVTVCPSHRSKVAVFWIALLFLTACYGNFYVTIITLGNSIRNVSVITVGGILGFAATRAWLRR